jgi:hypothetical protein
MKLVHHGYYVVLVDRDDGGGPSREVWQYSCVLGDQVGHCWLAPGDEEKVPFEWAKKILRRVRV